MHVNFTKKKLIHQSDGSMFNARDNLVLISKRKEEKIKQILSARPP